MANTPSTLQALLSTESSAALPRISAAQLLDAPENKALKEIWTQPATNPSELAGKNIAVISTDGVEEIELTTILHYFKSRGAIVDLIAPKKPSYPRYLGLQIPSQRATHILTIHYIETAGWIAFDKTLDDVTASAYDAFIIPGGCWNPDALRAESKVVGLISDAAKAGKVVAAVCHGPWVLSDAGVLKGKRATAWWSIRPDLENAGATYVDEPVVIDGNVVTSRAPIDLAPFVHAIGKLLAK
ncbi:MAG: intracellular protease, PfpI family protein [Acidobacteriaceae bacterium]|nr:intracellular protease, PfpI family protein [Acidobacteriaceae bacterium]